MSSNSKLQIEHESDPDVVRAELNRLLQEKRFSGAPQMSAFLRYIVTETLNGAADRIKAYSVGVDALGKPATFDAQNDPSVRVLALRLRKTLEAVYASGAPAHAIVSLRVGTYVPEFLKVDGISSPTGAVDHAGPGIPIMTPAVQAADRSGSQSTAQSLTDASIASSADVSNTAGDAASDNPVRIKTGGVLGGVLVMLAAAWLIASSHSGEETASPVKYASIAPLSSESLIVVPADNSREHSAGTFLPTLVLQLHTSSNRIERQIASLLGTSFFKAGTLSLVKTVDASDSDTNRETEVYELSVSELSIQGQSRIETQVIHQKSGAIVMAATLELQNKQNQVSSAELASIEQVATLIASQDGPVYQDYCQRSGSRGSEACLPG